MSPELSRIVELCSVGGCGNAAEPLPLLVDVRLGRWYPEIEIYLCAYHRGWYDATSDEEDSS